MQHIDHEAKCRYRPVIETYCTALRRVVSPYSDTTGDQYGFTQTILRVICSKPAKPLTALRPYDLFILTIVEFDDARFALDVHAKEAVEDGFTDLSQFCSEAKEDL